MLVWEKKEKKKHWQKINSTTLKSILKMKLWMCTATFQRATVYHYVLIQNKICTCTFWIVCMQKHLCLFKGKIWALRPNCVWGKCFDVLEVVPPSKYFWKIKQPCKTIFFPCVPPNRNDLNLLVVFFPHMWWLEFAGMSAGRALLQLRF